MQLFGREEERVALDELVAQTATGAGSLAIIEGSAGIGKSALLSYVRTRAVDRGLRVIAGYGHPFDSTVEYGLLRTVLECSSADGTAPVLAPWPPPREGLVDLFAASVVGAANGSPVVVTLDDAQWGDASSFEALGQFGRRAHSLPLSIVLAVRLRPDAPPALRTVLASSTVIRPTELSVEETASMVSHLLTDHSPDLAAACHDATSGNPFLVSELVKEIASAELSAARAVNEFSTLAPRTVVESVHTELSRHGRAVVQFAQALAVLDRSAGMAAIADVAELDTGEVVAAALTLRREGLLAGDGGAIRFAQPAIRTAMHASINEVERARLHHRAAASLHRRGGSRDEIAAHLLHAPSGLDAAMLSVLRAAAADAIEIGASAPAARLLRRLARELPPGDERDGVLVDLGTVGSASGLSDADDHLSAVLSRHDSGLIRVRASLGLARLRKVRGDTDEAVELFGNAIATTTIEPEIAAKASLELLGLGTTSRRARQLLAEQLVALDDPGGAPSTAGESFKLGVIACDRCSSGSANRAATIEVARRALQYPAVPVEPTRAAGASTLLAATALMYADELHEATDAYSQFVEAAHSRGALVDLSIGLSLRGWAEWRRGDISAADADARRAIELAWQVQVPHTLLSGALGVTGLVALHRTTDPTELRKVERAIINEPHDPDGTTQGMLLHARGLMHLGWGDAGGGVALLLEAGEAQESWGATNPATVPWRSDAARALSLLGRTAEARQLAGDELQRAQRFGSHRAIAVALGGVAAAHEDVSDKIGHLRQAAELLDGSLARLDRARALLDLGTALRCDRQIAEARKVLRHAEHFATLCGSSVLAGLARHELLASGARPRRVAIEGVESLTPTERTIAELAAAGRTNRMIARQLYVSPKTVETHLSHVYAKLNVASRRDLLQALGDVTN